MTPAICPPFDNVLTCVITWHMALSKKLTQFGNSYGIVIDKPILELLRITKDTELELSTDDGRRMIIQPKSASRSERLSPAHKRVAKNHGSTFRKLAK